MPNFTGVPSPRKSVTAKALQIKAGSVAWGWDGPSPLLVHCCRRGTPALLLLLLVQPNACWILIIRQQKCRRESTTVQSKFQRVKWWTGSLSYGSTYHMLLSLSDVHDYQWSHALLLWSHALLLSMALTFDRCHLSSRGLHSIFLGWSEHVESSPVVNHPTLGSPYPCYVDVASCLFVKDIRLCN